MTTKEMLFQLISDVLETDIAIREMARTVLSEEEVYGDDYGVPALEDIVELLVDKIKEKL